MFRIDTSTAAGALPDPQPAGAPGYFAYAPPGSGNPPTVLSSDWANGIQEELMSILAYAGVAPDKTSHNQVLSAIQSLVGGSAVVGAGGLHGLGTSNTPGFLTTSVSIAVGLTRDSTNSAGMALLAPISKSLTALWAPGGGNGGRDGGALANGQTWFVHLILNPTTGVIDALFSQSPTAPNLPAGFTKFRRLGAILLEKTSTSICQYIQTGDNFKLKLRSTDFAATLNNGGPFLRQVSVPNGIKVEAHFYMQSAGTVNSGSTGWLSGVFDPDFGAPPAWGLPTQWAQIRRQSQKLSDNTDASYAVATFHQFTDANRQVYTYSNDAQDLIVLGVIGWRDDRGKFY